MPYAAPVYQPPGARTQEQRKAEHDASRKDERIRGSRLTARNLLWLSMHPLCVTCEREDRVTAATEVDHTIPLCDGGPDDETNIQGLCHQCHVNKTNSERQQRRLRGGGGEQR